MNKPAAIDENMYYNGYKYRIYPTKEQAEFLDKCINISRFVYNWALEQIINNYYNYYLAIDNGEITDDMHRFLSEFDLCQLLTKLRKETDWLKEIPNTTCRSGIINLMSGLDKYFKGKAGLPKYRSKKKWDNQSFNTRRDRMYFNGTKLKIEGCDPIETKFDFGIHKPNDIEYYHPVISRDKIGNYYVSYYLVEPLKSDSIKISDNSEVIGIDLNKKNFFTLSNGKIFNAPEDKIKRLLKGIADCEKKCRLDFYRYSDQERTNPDDDIILSKRAEKRKLRKNKRYAKISNTMNTTIHQITAEIVKMAPKGIVMENLDVVGMKKNHFVAKHIHYYSFGRARKIMQMKCKVYGIPFQLAPTEYQSSNICSNCGYYKNINSYQYFICPNCGLRLDRDINAAKNLANLFCDQ